MSEDVSGGARRTFVTRFVFASAAAEALALILTRGLSLAVSAAEIRPEDPASALLPGLGVVGGILEGALLGAAQGRVGARAGALDGRPFAIRTAAGMGLAWSLGLFLARLEGATPTGPAFQLLATLGLGAALGAIVGATQRRAVTAEGARRGWIPSSAVAWTLGLVLGLFVEQFVPSDAGAGFSLAASALGGAVVGAAVGGVLSARLGR